MGSHRKRLTNERLVVREHTADAPRIREFFAEAEEQKCPHKTAITHGANIRSLRYECQVITRYSRGNKISRLGPLDSLDLENLSVELTYLSPRWRTRFVASLSGKVDDTEDASGAGGMGAAGIGSADAAGTEGIGGADAAGDAEGTEGIDGVGNVDVAATVAGRLPDGSTWVAALVGRKCGVYDAMM